MQQIVQLAYHKVHGKTVSAYCVAQHMAFKAGRNERMRGSTRASKAFIDKIVSAPEDVASQYARKALVSAARLPL
jgi:hypothetical protein